MTLNRTFHALTAQLGSGDIEKEMLKIIPVFSDLQGIT